VISWFKYVLHKDVAVYEALGWKHAAYLGGSHGLYSVLMEWCGSGDPVMPAKGDKK
jgi:hypothetical protein